MTRRRAIAPPDVPPSAGQYSAAVTGAGLLFASGQGPYRPDGTLIEGSVSEQLGQCVANLRAVARAAGTDLSHAVKVNVYLSQKADLEEYNRAYAKLFTESPPPARTTLRCAFERFDVEVDAVFCLDE